MAETIEDRVGLRPACRRACTNRPAAAHSVHRHVVERLARLVLVVDPLEEADPGVGDVVGRRQVGLGGSLTWRAAQNVADELPEPVANAIREGSFGTALARFSARAFVERIAERDSVSVEEARRRASALLALLREELPGSDVAQMDEELASWRPDLAS
jgi:hypothetical protein